MGQLLPWKTVNENSLKKFNLKKKKKMDLYYALPTNHPLRLALPEPNAKVATDYCLLSPYRIALWRRLLKFLLTDWFLLNHAYELLALPLPTDEEKLRAR